MIKEIMKDGSIMTNTTNNDIVYLNHRISTLAKPNNESSSMPDSLMNILKNRNTVFPKHIYSEQNDFRSHDA